MLELSGWSVTKVSATAKKGEGLHQLRVTCVKAICTKPLRGRTPERCA